MTIGIDPWQHLPAVPCLYCHTPVCPHCVPDQICGDCRQLLMQAPMEIHRPLDGWDDDFLINSAPKRRRKSTSRLEVEVGGEEPPKRKLPVAKHVDNTVAPPPATTLGFIYDIANVGEPGSPRWLVQMETVDGEWLLKIWTEVLLPLGAADLAAMFRERDFESVWFAMKPEQRALAYRVHRAYVERTIQADDPAPTALIQFLVRPDRDGWGDVLRESRWYELKLSAPLPYVDFDTVDVDDFVAGYAELALDFENDPELATRQISQLSPATIDPILKVLHLPQWDPAQEEPGPRGGGGGGGSAPLRNRAMRAITRVRDGLIDLAEDLFGGPPGGLVLAPAGVTLPRFPARRPRDERPIGTAPAEYHASPLPAALAAAQMPNPMLPGAQQPFVGILNIGQGNCNVLYGNNGRVVCYFDLGYPSPFYGPTAPRLQYAPCTHDDPQVFLSSWDWDHCSFARRIRTAWHLRWIVPQQNVGPAVIQQVYAQVVASAHGGSMNVWPGAAPAAAVAQHVPLPWGYLERGLAANQIANRNEGGLVMYVCVSSAGVAAVGMPAVAANAVAPRGGAAPPATQAEAAAAAARAAVAGLGVQALVQAVADAADLATRSFVFAGAAPAPADVARAALAAVGGLIGRAPGSTWVHALDAMSAAGTIAGGGALNAAATAIRAAYPGGGIVAVSAAASLAVGGVPGALVGVATQTNVAMTLAIADAAVAAVAGGGGAAAGAALATTTAAAGAGAFAAAAPMIAPVAVVNAAVAPMQIDAQLGVVAAAGAGAAAEAVIANGGAPALAAGVYAVATVAAVSRLVATDGNWSWAFGGMRDAAVLFGNAINAAHVAGGAYAGAIAAAPLASMQATIPGAGLGGVAGGMFGGAAAVLERWAAGAAISDAAEASNVSVLAIIAAGPIGGGAAAVQQAAAEAGAGVAPVAHGAPLGNSRAEACIATNQPVGTRDAVGWGREAARQILLALFPGAAAGMPPQTAPLPAAGGYAALAPGAAAPPGGLAAAAMALGAAAPGGANLLTNIQGGPGPVNAAERWVLLTGDMSFEMMPTQEAATAAAPGNAANWPVVVGLTASHHGANTCFPNAASRSYIPFAPGSAGAYAAASAAQAAALAAATQIAVAAAAYETVELASHLNDPTRRVAFAAVTAMANAANGAPNAGAALAAVAGMGGGFFDVVAAAQALSAIGGATAQARIAASAGNSAAPIVAFLAAQLLSAQLGAGMTVAIAQACAAGAAAVLPLGGGVAGVAAALPAVAAALGNAAVTGAVGGAGPGAAAGAAAAGLVAGDWVIASVVAGFVAAVADAIGAMAAGPANPALASALAARGATTALVADHVALTAAGPAVPPGSFAAALLPAAPVFWPHGLGLGGGLPNLDATFGAAAVHFVTDVVVNGAAADVARIAASSQAVAMADLGCGIAYSYGVRNTPGNYRHYYGLANARHPHPNAVRAYAGTGWTRRRNPSVNAWQGQQPDPFAGGAAAGAFVPGGNIAMGWEDVAMPAYLGMCRGDGGAGTFDRAECALCGNIHFVVC